MTPPPSPRRTFCRELPADLDTPVSVFLRLQQADAPAFLLESVTGGEQLARYSFIGVDPGQIFVLRGRTMEIHSPDGIRIVEAGPDASPLNLLREQLRPDPNQQASPSLPRFTGGLVGYFGHEMVRFFEPSIPLEPHAVFPDAIFFHADTLVAFDHAFGRLLLIATAADEHTAHERLDRLQARLERPARRAVIRLDLEQDDSLAGNLSHELYRSAASEVRTHIAAGDIFQAVISQRLSRRTSAQPFEIYRELRRLNPSPYMFYFDFGTVATPEPFRLIGASPEMHVRLENRMASLRPIAGTRPRGSDHAADERLEAELLADPKERAEHLMLIDLARNDLGRVCEYGSVQVSDPFTVERYSHVMHIVSQTNGRLREGLDAFDLLAATFPAGTVSGAPKVRALQIIRGLEPEPRGPYAGAVGYFGYDGNADTCIALRTLVMHGQTVHIQAGAGIVADSDPDREYEETLHKGQALALAVARAERGRNGTGGAP